MANPTYTVHVYNSMGVLLNIVANIESARYRVAENEVGDFDITVPWGDGTVPTFLTPPNRVEFWRDSQWVFGGIIRRQNIKQDGKVPFYTASGPDYMQWLADARMRPSTGTADIPFAAMTLDDTIKNAVSTQVLDSVNYFTVQANTGLSLKNETYTATAYIQVLEALQNIATRAQDTTFGIVRENNALVFKTWTPSRGQDRSKGTASPVLFDLRGGNLLNAEWNRDGNDVANAVWAGGPGDKAARYIWPPTEALTNGDSILDWGRIESFIDAGNETTTEVNKKAQEELDKQSVPEESVTFQISQFGRYTLGTDFDFGTKVTVMWTPILEFTDRIKGMEVRLDSGAGVASVDINVGDTITGDSQTRASIFLGRYLRQLRRTISVQTRH